MGFPEDVSIVSPQLIVQESISAVLEPPAADRLIVKGAALRKHRHRQHR